MRKRTGYLIRRGKVFYACWTVAGKKFMKSTGKRDRREAEKELHRIMEPFVVGDEVATLQNIRTKIEGRTAELTRLEDERNPPLTVAATWDAYIAVPSRPDSGPGTLANYESHFVAFAKWLKRTHPGDCRALRDVTPAIAGEYTTHLTGEQGLSANSFNKHVRFLELLFRVLKEPAATLRSSDSSSPCVAGFAEQGAPSLRSTSRLTVNPWEGIQRKRVITVSRRELTIDELKKVCESATGDLRLLLALGIYTGLRLGDCATLRWGEVDLRRRVIRRIPSKIARRNPRPVIIPIHPVLAGMLSDIPENDRKEYVLPRCAADYQRHHSYVRDRVQKHFEKCGIRTRKEAKEGRLLASVEVGFHSLRHSFMSLCRESNAPLAVVEAIVGHSNPAMTRHYTHVSELAAAHAVNGLPAVIGEAPAPDGSAFGGKALPPPKLIDAAPIRALTEKLNAKTWRTVKAEVREYVEGGRSAFGEWFDRLYPVTAARVDRYIRRMEAGNFGAAKALRGGVYELRLDFGPGYRVYYGIDGRTLVILLGGGEKRRQSADIAAAVER